MRKWGLEKNQILQRQQNDGNYHTPFNNNSEC
jgi:hypothetical protein